MPALAAVVCCEDAVLRGGGGIFGNQKVDPGLGAIGKRHFLALVADAILFEAIKGRETFGIHFVDFA